MHLNNERMCDSTASVHRIVLYDLYVHRIDQDHEFQIYFPQYILLLYHVDDRNPSI